MIDYETFRIIRILFIVLLGIGIYKLIEENILYIKARWFFMDSENLKLYNAVIRYVKEIAEELGNPGLKDYVIEIANLEEFDKLNLGKRDYVSRCVRVIEKDKEACINFFKWRGDL